jgi:hypothetical protein
MASETYTPGCDAVLKIPVDPRARLKPGEKLNLYGFEWEVDDDGSFIAIIPAVFVDGFLTSDRAIFVSNVTHQTAAPAGKPSAAADKAQAPKE